MFGKGLGYVKGQVLHDVLNAFQFDSEFSEKQDLLQAVHFRLSVDAVARRVDSGRLQKVNLIIVPQRPGADPGQPSQLLNCIFHVFAS